MNGKRIYFAIGCFLMACLIGCNEHDTTNEIQNKKDNNINVNQQKDVQPQIRIVLEEVPENISNRGVILLGKDKGEPHRADPDPDIPNEPWYERYTADCNLSVESTDSELEEFVKKIDENASFSSQKGGGEYGYIKKSKKSGSPEYLFYIHPTYTYKGDVSQGYVMYYMEEGMSCGTEVFYDPSGKYLMDTALWAYEIPDDIFIQFLEPEMVEVKYNPDFLGNGEDVVLTETEDIEKVLDLMHSLELKLEKEDCSVLAMAEYQSVISFTDINGNVNDYKIIGAYLIHGDDVYFVENSDKLKNLEETIKKYEEENKSEDEEKTGE